METLVHLRKKSLKPEEGRASQLCKHSAVNLLFKITKKNLSLNKIVTRLTWGVTTALHFTIKGAGDWNTNIRFTPRKLHVCWELK